MIGLWVTVSLAVFSGLTMYSIYKNCDPLTNGDVGALDQVSKCKTAMALTQAWTVLHYGSVLKASGWVLIFVLFHTCTRVY